MKAKRKLLVTGNYTYLVTLPKAWARKLKWRAKQMLELELKPGSVEIRDFPDPKRR